MTKAELKVQILAKKTMLCIGLDPDIARLPKHLLNEDNPQFSFNKEIIDKTRNYCVAYKPNLAFYEAQGKKGWEAFEQTVEYIGDSHFIIADAKRGDIGNTSRLYAQAFFEQNNCNAITVAPYMGRDSVLPFLEFEGKWVILLALTSNAGSADFQFLETQNNQKLYEKVLLEARNWATDQTMMFVVGATHPEKFAKIRELVPNHFLLVPGIGAQGGNLKEVCRHGMNADIGLLINSSREIIFASEGIDFAEKAAQKAAEIQQQMAHILNVIGGNWDSTNFKHLIKK